MNEKEAFKREILERIDSFFEKYQADKKTEFEKGKWYNIRRDGERAAIINYRPGPATFGFGFNWGGYWTNDFGQSDEAALNDYARHASLATPEEIQSALIKEAERRGFKEGVPYVDARGNKGGNQITNLKNAWYDPKYDELINGLCATGVLYRAGKWASIIKDEAIKIGGYEVKFHANGTTIDGHSFGRKFWEGAAEVARHSKAKVKIGCSHQFDLPLETIQKILNGFSTQ